MLLLGHVMGPPLYFRQLGPHYGVDTGAPMGSQLSRKECLEGISPLGLLLLKIVAPGEEEFPRRNKRAPVGDQNKAHQTAHQESLVSPRPGMPESDLAKPMETQGLHFSSLNSK